MNSPKIFYLALIIGVLLMVTALGVNPTQTSWFGSSKDFLVASFLSSIWEKAILYIIPSPTKAPGGNPPGLNPVPEMVSTGCYPPVPPKPVGSDVDGRYGPMTITPIVSTAGPNNIITVTITPDFAPTEVTLSIGHFLIEDIVDWGPKNLNGGKFFKESGKLGWYAGKTSLLPEKVPYWLKIRANRPTVPAKVPRSETYNTDEFNTFWRSIGYGIGNAGQGISSGRHAYLVNGPETPTLFFDVSKQKTVEPNGAFEVTARSKWQAGTITLNIPSSAAKILGEKTVQAKANEVKTWRVQPLYNEENSVDLGARLKNNCGEDTAYGGWKIQYDYSKLTPDKVIIHMEQNYAIGLGTSIESGTGITLYTLPETKVGVPNITFTVRAVYADKRDEIVKNVLLYSYTGAKTWQAGQTTTKTTSFGLAPLIVKIPKLTAEEAKRKIILMAETNDIKELRTETPLLIRVPAVNVPTVKSISVTADSSLEGLKEGDKVNFKVLAAMSDGSEKTLTRDVAWAVVGDIGSISVSGIFEARLGQLIAEYGEGGGAVTASYKDADGNPFLGKTAPFKIEASAPDGGDVNAG
ncbi:MAG: hypothetical protein HYR95_02390 [Candidatus Colwellbacteria bacterium]|nr:hypothetical protein [Candidatus Colwellbacteria bacterium]